MNLLESNKAKKMFKELARGATRFRLSAEGIRKDFESKDFQALIDAVFMFETICNAAKGELTIISTSMQDKSMYIQFSYFKKGTNELTNQVRLAATF